MGEQHTPHLLQIGSFEDAEDLSPSVEVESVGEVRVRVCRRLIGFDTSVIDDTDLVLLDGGPRGLEALVSIKSKFPERPVLMLVDPDDPDTLRRAVEHGLDGYAVRYETWEETWGVLEVLIKQSLSSAPGLSVTAGLPEGTAANLPDLHADAFWNFFDASPIGIKILTPDNRIMYANSALEEMLGFSSEELTELTERELIHPQDVEEGRRSFDALREGEVDDTEIVLRHITSDGEPVETALGRVALRDENEELKYVLETIVDLQRAGLSGEGGRAAAGGAADAFFTELAAGIAHDLRNILSLIALDTEFLRHQAPEDPEIAETLDRVIEAAERGSRMVKRFSRLGQSAASLVEVDLSVYLHDFAELLANMVPAEVELEIETQADQAIVEADYAQLDQIVLNLVRNAAEAAQGPITVDVEIVHEQIDEQEKPDAQPELESGDYAVLCVHDNGAGMDDETRDQIFQPYFSTKQSEGGIGLGLANVFRAVRELGGSIRVETEPGEGSTFEVYLPLVE